MKFNFNLKIVLFCFFLIVLGESINSTKKTLRSKYSRISLEKIKSLRYKNHLQSLLSAREPRQDDDLPDPEVVYAIYIASHGKDKATCPYPLELAESSCGSDSPPCDLNRENGGNYAYLCIGRKKISKLSYEENMVNQIIININNQDCGNLNSVKSTIKNSRFFSDEITLCYGHDDKIKPFFDLRFFDRQIPETVIPEHCTIEIADNKFLCPIYAEKAPMKIEFSELNLLTQEDNFKILGKPETVAEIENDNGAGKTDNSVKRMISVLKVKTSSWNIENKLGTKIESKISTENPVISVFKVTASHSFEFNYSNNRGETSTKQELEQIDYSCVAPPGKFYKCVATNNKIKADIPYTIKRTVFYHDGKKETKQISSTFNGLMTSSLKFERCCYRYCGESDKLCNDSDKNSKDNRLECPKLEDAETIAPAEIEEKKIFLDSKLDSSVITDIRVIEGQSTTCSYGYEFVKNSKDYAKFETNIGSTSPYIYVCVKKIVLSKILDKPINAIRLNKRNSDCGLLHSSKKIINDNESLIICYGYDPLSSLSPISDLLFTETTQISNLKAKDYICDLTEFKTNFTLCYKRNTNAPKTVQLRNYQYDYAGMKKFKMGPPKKVNEIIVGSTSATLQVKSVERTEMSEKTTFEFGRSISIGLDAKFLKVNASANSKISHSKENKDATEKSESTTFECSAAEPKKIKCIASMFQFKVHLPYSADLIHIDYDGKEIVNFNTKISGIYEDIASSGLTISSCCLENCCEGDETEESKKPWCLNKENKPVSRDRLCSELEICFNQPPKGFRIEKRLRKRRY